MNAAETIQAAIDKLRPQSWEAAGDRMIVDRCGNLVAANVLPSDRDLILAMTRSIDAQLAILRAALMAHRGFVPDALSSTERAAFDLARAILGEDS